MRKITEIKRNMYPLLDKYYENTINIEEESQLHSLIDEFWDYYFTIMFATNILKNISKINLLHLDIKYGVKFKRIEKNERNKASI